VEEELKFSPKEWSAINGMTYVIKNETDEVFRPRPRGKSPHFTLGSGGFLNSTLATVKAIAYF